MRLPEKEMKNTMQTETEIVDLALQWLAIFDQGNLSKCWESASPELKKQVDEQDFVLIMSNKRAEKGAVVSHELQDAGVEMTYHRRPDLVHRVLQFQASPVTGNQFQELVTLVKADDASWQVANYTTL